MVEAHLITASTNPAMMLPVADPSRYIPEIFYNQRNEYNREIKQVATQNGFPVEYLLVTVTHGFPKEETANFSFLKPWIVDTGRLLGDINPGDPDQVLSALASFETILFLWQKQLIDATTLSLVASVLRGAKDRQVLFSHPAWQSFLSTILTHQMQGSNIREAPSAPWACQHCTFLNEKVQVCEMCGLPRE